MKATAIAHANIALVKYWGKRDIKLNLPAVGSISMTLRDLFTQSSIFFSEEFSEDILILNGQPAGEVERRRVSSFLDIFRDLSGVRMCAKVESHNNFPTGAGLASSASGFAALTIAASAALGLELSSEKLSILARQGSGSAARSIYGGFVEMKKGELPDGSDAYAIQLYDENYWNLDMLILITSEEEKEISSTRGMKLTAETSPYYSAWVQSSEDDL
ncbi:MAG: diphosphomevalonate decarboxylase, partial [Calditrichaeota bacterium]